MGFATPQEEQAWVASKEVANQIEQAAIAKVKYIYDRRAAMPDVRDLLMMLWSDMDSGKIPQAPTFYAALKTLMQQYTPPVAITPAPGVT